MASHSPSVRAEEIETFVLREVPKHAADIGRLAAERFGISRQAIHRHLQRMVTEGKLVATGVTRQRQYTPATVVLETFTLDVSPALDEHLVWSDRVEPLLRGLPRNVFEICHYGFTEMLNNVVDHSGSSTVTITVNRTTSYAWMVVHDEGVGIFRKITGALELPDERLAVLELSKGKLTTDPKRHSGEGIFFTSRMFDTFALMSGSIALHCHGGKSVLLDRREPYLPVEGDLAALPEAGTTVFMQISALEARPMVEVFNQFSGSLEEDYGFTRTRVPVSLARFGDANLVSRSQAKRLLARFDRFKEVMLDFSGVETVGQAFADEIFRVFQKDHPEVHLTWVNVTPAVEGMIRRALAAGREP